MFTRIQRLLDVRPALDLRELVTIFGCLQLQPSVEQLLRAYKTRFLASLPAEERARADLTRPAFLAAAFLLAAKKHKAKVDRAALTNKMGLTRGELEGALKDVASRCADMLQPPQQQSAGEGGDSARRKRARADAAGEEPAADGTEAATTSGAGGGRSSKAAKRPRRAGAAAAEVEEDEAAVAAASAHDVAVEDLRLVLCGIRPAAAAPGGEEEDDGEEEAERSKKRTKKGKRAKKGSSRGDSGGGEEDGEDEERALQRQEAAQEGAEEKEVERVGEAKKGKAVKKGHRAQADEAQVERLQVTAA